jgi:hypothetical protein
MSAAIACEKPEDDPGSVAEARDAIPTAESLRIDLPSGSAAKPGVGAPSGAYLLTLATAVTLNGSVGVFLGLVRLIVAFPVTSVEGRTYTWGPWHDQDRPGEYKLVVTFSGDHVSWTLEGRRFGEAGSFQAVVRGEADRGERAGAFTMDFTLARTIDPTSEAEGTIDVSYDAGALPRTLTIDAENRTAGQPATFHYEYRANADRSGELRWMAFGDTDDPGPAAETAQWHARWKPDGSGRADAQVTGGDLGNATVNASECWNAWPLFRTVFYTDSVGWIATQGVAGECAYP